MNLKGVDLMGKLGLLDRLTDAAAPGRRGLPRQQLRQPTLGAARYLPARDVLLRGVRPVRRAAHFEMLFGGGPGTLGRSLQSDVTGNPRSCLVSTGHKTPR